MKELAEAFKHKSVSAMVASVKAGKAFLLYERYFANVISAFSPNAFVILIIC